MSTKVPSKYLLLSYYESISFRKLPKADSNVPSKKNYRSIQLRTGCKIFLPGFQQLSMSSGVLIPCLALITPYSRVNILPLSHCHFYQNYLPQQSPEFTLFSQFAAPNKQRMVLIFSDPTSSSIPSMIETMGTPTIKICTCCISKLLTNKII